jgi:3-oxoacyl-[acyl-carrier-protein] synthase III
VTDIGVGAIRCLLPEAYQKVTDLPEYPDLGHDEQRFARDCGVETVGVLDGEDGAGLAARACRDLLADAFPGAPRPDALVLVAPRAPDVLLGSDAGHVQHAAGLGGGFSFTLDGLGCAGSSAAWGLARDLLAADPARQAVLIAHASRPTGVDRIRYPVAVIGDGACAMTLVRGGRPRLVAHRVHTDGRFHDLFRVDYRQAPWYEWREECASPDRYRFELAMHSRIQLSGLVDAVLADAGATRADVRATLMQNVTAGAFDFYETLLGLPIHEVCRENLARLGHLGAMDVVLNLDRLLARGSLRRGDLVLVLNNSPVAAWAATLWEV